MRSWTGAIELPSPVISVVTLCIQAFSSRRFAQVADSDYAITGNGNVPFKPHGRWHRRPVINIILEAARETLSS
jgi:hypothetical protein